MPPFERRLAGPQADSRIIILVNDTPVDAVFDKHGHYSSVFVELFERSMALEPKVTRGIEFLAYDCVKGEYPSDDELRSACGVVLTGSAASAYEPIPWITKLVDFIAQLPTRHPHCKIIGICFGHQIAAVAFGGKVTKCPDGWELGVRTLDLTPLGRQILAPDGAKNRNVEEVHQDYVAVQPDGFENLAASSLCPFQGFVRFSSKPQSDTTLKELYKHITVLTLQGHPEFTADIVHELTAVREAQGILTKDFCDQSRKDASLPQDGTLLGRVILDILGAS